MALSYTSKYKPNTIFLLIGGNMNELHHYPGKEWLHPLFHVSKICERCVYNQIRSYFDEINNLCKKAIQKLSALARVVPSMYLEKRKTVMIAFVTLIWMFHSRSLNNKINSLHKRALRLT